MEPSGHADSPPNVHLTIAASKQVAIAGRGASSHSDIPTIPRSSSYDHVPNIVQPDSQCHPRIIQRTRSDNALTSLAHPTEDVSRHSSLRKNTTVKDQGLRRQSSVRLYMNGIPDTSHCVGIERKPRSVSGSLTSFAKKSWATASRSPSPCKRPIQGECDAVSVPGLCQTVAFPPAAAISEKVGDNLSNAMAESTKKGTIEGKKSRRPLSAFLSRASSDSKVHVVQSIPKAFSSDTLSAMNHLHHSTNTPLVIPRSISSDRLHILGNDSPRRRDELWGAFRALDSEFHKFQARPNISKTGIVRSALLPFLRNYAEHPSNTTLKPDELDRRIQVLNQWWIGLLEMLNGRNGESVSGNDRPAILEAATAIMIRHEWDLYPLPSVARPSTALRQSLTSRSTTSLGSTASEFLADSVYHNIKNAFQQNLLAQMTYVVDKMSNRNVPASVVTFCGKAAAYAFFYCDGVAETLVRIWNISPEVLRRVVAENGISRDADLKSASERIIARFPDCLHGLSFRSLQTMAKHLRKQPQMPISTGHISWWQGSWVGRWTGRDTDLFFTFAKAYYTLISRVLPEDHTSEEIISTPAHALIQAQILNLLDATMQHTVSHTPLNHLKEPHLMTFDDILGETNASTTLLPIPSILRPMAENRLIILLRDFLSGASTATDKGREFFASTFELLLKASARRISVFDHDGCFTLCDFMEEALVIMDRYHQTSDSTNLALDWPFWLEVMRKLMESQNTMTEIRLYALLYTLWGMIVMDETRKSEICLEWLLREDFFQAQFNHWCPMVRAYFMRVLCWRVARVEGNGSELDRRILETLSLRLERSWCYYLYLKDFSANSGLMPPSTVPCSPAPGRRLLIVRDDLQASSSGMFLNFDSILSNSSSTQATAYERHSSLQPLAQDTASITRATRTTTQSANTGKRRWGLLKNIIPFTIGPTDRPQELPQVQNPITDKEPSPNTIPGDGEPGGNSKFDRPGKKLLTMSSRSSLLDAPLYNGHSFKFSLEWIDKDKVLTDKEKDLQPPQLPIGAQIFLKSQRGRKRHSEPCKPTGAAVKPSKYVGRALAEWSAIITECQSFFERRRIEGIPLSFKLETPTLGVEPFRKFG